MLLNRPLMTRIRGIFSAPALLTVLLSVAALEFVTAAPTAGPAMPTVAVSIIPQAEFVSRIAKDKVAILTLVGPGSSPHNYEPTPRQMASLSTASLWFTTGVEFENALLPKVRSLYPKVKIVDTVKNVRFRSLEAHGHDEDSDEHDAGKGEANAGAGSDLHEEDLHAKGRDPHVWLGYGAVKSQLAEIRDALVLLLPGHAAFFKANHDAFLRDIDTVFTGLGKELAPLRGEKVFVYHPSFGYFFDEFGLEQVAVEVGGKEPTQKTLAELIARARVEKAKVIFVQKQFPAAAARTVANAMNGSVVEIDPLAADWLANLSRMGAALAAGAAKTGAR
jgi:zinc transport system substrate-binding protein